MIMKDRGREGGREGIYSGEGDRKETGVKGIRTWKVFAEQKVRQLIVLHGASAFVCMYVSNTALQCKNVFPVSATIACTCSGAKKENLHYMTRLTCREAVVIRKAMYICMQQHRSSSSKERSEHWREVHQQRLRLIRQQKSNGLANSQLSSVMQLNSRKALRMDYMYALVLTYFL